MEVKTRLIGGGSSINQLGRQMVREHMDKITARFYQEQSRRVATRPTVRAAAPTRTDILKLRLDVAGSRVNNHRRKTYGG